MTAMDPAILRELWHEAEAENRQLTVALDAVRQANEVGFAELSAARAEITRLSQVGESLVGIADSYRRIGREVAGRADEVTTALRAELALLKNGQDGWAQYTGEAATKARLRAELADAMFALEASCQRELALEAAIARVRAELDAIDDGTMAGDGWVVWNRIINALASA